VTLRRDRHGSVRWRTDQALGPDNTAGSSINGRIRMKTDCQLKHDVLVELRWEPSVNAAQVGAERAA